MAGAIIKNAPDFFQRNQFTYNLNLKYNYIQEGTGSRAAVFLGNSDSTAFRVIPAKSQSQSVLRVGTNAGAKDYPLTTALTAGDWHALSIVYTEDEQQGYVALYCDGAKVLNATGIGFKLSNTTNLAAGIGAAYGTSYLSTVLMTILLSWQQQQQRKKPLRKHRQDWMPSKALSRQTET